jgi:acyl-CoA synthetase (AMP-forming)/AMP-acid ligase II
MLNLNGVKAIVCAGEFIDSETLDNFYFKFATLGLRQSSISTGYGMAEMAGAITQSLMFDPPKTIRLKRREYVKTGRIVLANEKEKNAITFVSSGKPVGNLQIKINGKNECGKTISEGEIVILSPETSSIGNEIRRLQLPTGDLGFIMDGELFVTGRSKDVLIISGKNYSPIMLENIIRKKMASLKFIAFDQFDKKSATNVLCIYIQSEISVSRERELLENAIRKIIYQQTKLVAKRFFYTNVSLLTLTKSGKLMRRQSIDVIKKHFKLSR